MEWRLPAGMTSADAAVRDLEPGWHEAEDYDPLAMAPSYIVGLDLGQAQDYSALTILERGVKRLPDGQFTQALDLRHLGRWPLRTPYPEIVGDMRRMLGAVPLARRSSIVVDATGVGRAVVNLFQASGVGVIPVTITAARKAMHRDGAWYVPKRDLVAALAVGFETHALRVAAALEYAKILMREIDAFRAKVTLSGNDTYEAWRERDHDDLVLSAAMAVWWAHNSGGRMTPEYQQRVQGNWMHEGAV